MATLNTVQLKLKEPINKTFYKFNDLIITLVNDPYNLITWKWVSIGGNHIYITRSSDSVNYILSSENKGSSNDLTSAEYIDDKTIKLNSIGYANDYNKHLYINGTGQISIRDGYEIISQIGGSNAWGSSALPFQMYSSDINYSNINSISIQTLIIDSPINKTLYNFSINRGVFPQNNFKMLSESNITVRRAMKFSYIDEYDNKTLIFITFVPDTSYEGPFNFEIGKYIRMKINEDYSNPININIYSNFYFASVDDINRFILGQTGKVNIYGSYTFYPKPTVSIDAFTALCSNTPIFADYE